MQLFLKCYFNGWNGRTGDLISMALVSLDSDVIFYEEIICKNPTPWTKIHVLPNLNKVALSLSDFELKLANFLWAVDELYPNGFEIVTNYPADIELFCRALLYESDEFLLRPEQCLLTPSLTFKYMHLSIKPSKLNYNSLEDAKVLREDFKRTQIIHLIND